MMIEKLRDKKYHISFLIIFIALGIWYWFSLPRPLFNDPYSTVIESREGYLLGAKIADDGQWRFPEKHGVPLKFQKCITTFEDKYFFNHAGYNPYSIIRAFYQNIKSGRIVSGGSTLTMQVIRLSRKGENRTFIEKLKELFLATRLELSNSKEKILSLYSSHAPFGGNVVGLDAASWRYFGRGAEDLSWGETASLAVLPNAPSLIYPGKNELTYLKKRNRLLHGLYENGTIDSLDCALAKKEPLPQSPLPMPGTAKHLLMRTYKNNKGKKITTSIDRHLQKKVNHIISRNLRGWKANGIHNAAVLVLDVKSGEVLSYVGNTPKSDKKEYGNDVDVIMAPRSTGSLLKPFLYAAMQDDGELLPNTLVPDIPTDIAGYTPKNYNRGYDGAVPAHMALARSLNIPSVRMLQEYGVGRFHHFMQKLGMNTLIYPSSHYGLSLILGGCEGKLWELCGLYASMARVLNHYEEFNGEYSREDWRMPHYIMKEELKMEKSNIKDAGLLSAGSIWLTFKALLKVNRPVQESGWEYFDSSGKIAWKTGTSFGFRDAWAIGTTPEYVVGVWVGNADGEGRPGLTGTAKAAPVMFDVFDHLKTEKWFPVPYDDLRKIRTCKKSGYRALDICEPKDSSWVEVSGLKTAPCPYHKLIHTDITGSYRVNSSCERIENISHKPWFVLPPAMEWFYKSKSADYKVIPPYRSDCKHGEGQTSMELIYPKAKARIYIPKELEGEQGRTVFEVAHRNPAKVIYWHLDNQYIGQTKRIHQLELNPSKGKHTLTLVDENGNTLSRSFEVVNDKNI